MNCLFSCSVVGIRFEIFSVMVHVGSCIGIWGWATVFFYYPYIICSVLSQYSNIVQALRRGDLRLLRHALQENEDQYVLFIYFTLGSLKLSIKFIFSEEKLESPSPSCNQNNEFFPPFKRFLRSGVYLVLEKLELQVYQRLFKKM